MAQFTIVPTTNLLTVTHQIKNSARLDEQSKNKILPKGKVTQKVVKKSYLCSEVS